MNILKTTLLTMTLGLTTVTASADERTGPETRVVEFVSLNTTSATAAEELYQRLRVAAQQVCVSAQGTMLSVRLQYRTCVDRALANAIKQLKQPLVTQAYGMRTKGGTIRVPSR